MFGAWSESNHSMSPTNPKRKQIKTSNWLNCKTKNMPNAAKFRKWNIHIHFKRNNQQISISVVQPKLPCFGKHKATARFETKMQDQMAHRIRTENLTPRCDRRRCVRATNMYFRTMKSQIWIIRIAYREKRIVHDKKIPLCARGVPESAVTHWSTGFNMWVACGWVGALTGASVAWVRPAAKPNSVEAVGFTSTENYREFKNGTVKWATAPKTYPST